MFDQLFIVGLADNLFVYFDKLAGLRYCSNNSASWCCLKHMNWIEFTDSHPAVLFELRCTYSSCFVASLTAYCLFLQYFQHLIFCNRTKIYQGFVRFALVVFHVTRSVVCRFIRWWKNPMRCYQKTVETYQANCIQSCFDNNLWINTV